MTTPTWRCLFGDLAARGAGVALCALVEGVPTVFVSAGSVVTSVASPPGGFQLDPAFWPGAGAGIAAYTLGVLDWKIAIRNGVRGPAQPDNPRLTLRLHDVADALTVLFSALDVLPQTNLTASVTAAAVTIPVDDTSAFPASGDAWVQRECFSYTGTTGTSFTGCTRGQYGSVATFHNWTQGGAAGSGALPQIPTVWGGVAYLPGRRLTLWLLDVSAGTGVARAPRLLFDGRIGKGGLTGLDTPDWTVPADGAWQYLGAEGLALPPIPATGYAHPSAARIPGLGGAAIGLLGQSALAVGWDGSAPFGLAATSAATDNGGWHGWAATPAGGSFFAAFTAGTQTATLSMVVAFNTANDGRINVALVNADGASHTATIVAPWDPGGLDFGAAGVVTIPAHSQVDLTSRNPFPAAWIGLGNGPLYVQVRDAQGIPPLPVPGVPAGASASFALVPQDPTGAKLLNLAGSFTTGPATSINQVPALAILQVINTHPLSPQPPAQYVSPAMAAVVGVPIDPLTGLVGAGPASSARLFGLVLTAPAAFSLGVYAVGTTWPLALQGAAAAWEQLGVATDFGQGAAGTLDWARIADVVALAPTPLNPGRAYFLAEPLGKTLANEMALAGLTPCVYQGRWACARLAIRAPTEPAAATITRQTMLGNPAAEQSRYGIVNAMTLTLPGAANPTTVGSGSRVPVAIQEAGTLALIDQGSVATFGPGAESFAATVPPGAQPFYVDPTQIYLTLLVQLAATLGMWSAPLDVVTFRLPLTFGDVEIGDGVAIPADEARADWLIPAGDRTRGLRGRVGTVLGTNLALFDGGRGSVELTAVFGPNTLTGYNVAALVASISGAVLTLDTTTLGGQGFAPDPAATDGGAAGFTGTGVVVELVELDNPAPLATATFAVLSVSGATVTLATAPAGAWNTIATSGAFRLLVRCAVYASATGTVTAPGLGIGSLVQGLFAFTAATRGARLGGVAAVERTAP